MSFLLPICDWIQKFVFALTPISTWIDPLTTFALRIRTCGSTTACLHAFPFFCRFRIPHIWNLSFNRYGQQKKREKKEKEVLDDEPLPLSLQDWDFPHFIYSLDIKLPGVNTAHIRIHVPRILRKEVWAIHITGD